MFFLFPLTMFGLSMAGPIPLYLFTVSLIIILSSAVVITQLQRKAPGRLPSKLRSWSNIVPLWLHSLDPWDHVMVSMVSCCCRSKTDAAAELKEVIIARSNVAGTGASSFPSVAYTKLPVKPKVERKRSSNSCCVHPSVPG